MVLSPPDGRLGFNTLTFDITKLRISTTDVQLRGDSGTVEMSTILQRNTIMNVSVRAPQQPDFPLHGGGVGTFSFPVVFQEITLNGGGYIVVVSATPD